MGGMKSREERRTSERRVLLWSLTIAVVVHVLAFLYLPGLRPNEFADLEDQTDELALVTGSAIPLDLFFGPPVIRGAEGSLNLEPPERVHGEGRAVFVSAGCKRLIEESADVFYGTVRLSVLETGLVQVAGVVESSGTVCGDYVIERVAADLLYRWLPNDEFPAPVELVQPLTFAAATGLT